MLSPYVVELEVRQPYSVWVRFDDGTAGEVDLSDSAKTGGIFSAWSDSSYWRSAHIVADSGAVAWGDGDEVDVCPLSLYLDLTGRSQAVGILTENSSAVLMSSAAQAPSH